MWNRINMNNDPLLERKLKKMPSQSNFMKALEALLIFLKVWPSEKKSATP
jgi:hypothetical protein